jgi:hypothetical protein
MMMRNGFVREEKGRLILASGIPRRWLAEAARRGEALRFGPAPTPYGEITVKIEFAEGAEPRVTAA